MAFQVSPGVNVSEIDLSGVIPAVSVSVGAIAGVFRWGPANERVLVSNEKQLARIFGEPKSYYTDNTFVNTWTNHETFFSAANFLSYSNALYVTRVLGDTAATASSTNFDAKYAGALGNSIAVSYASTDSAGTTSFNAVEYAGNVLTIDPFTNQGTIPGYTTPTSVEDEIDPGDAIILTDGTKLIVSAVTSQPVAGGVSPAEILPTSSSVRPVADATTNADIDFGAGGTITSTTTDLSVFRTGEIVTVSGSANDDGQYKVTGTPTPTSVSVTNVDDTPATLSGDLDVACTISGQFGSVNLADDEITATAHGFVTGDIVLYNDAGGTAIEGLSSGSYYYIIRVDADTFKLATSVANAGAGTAIDLTGFGVGTVGSEHTFSKPTSYRGVLTFESKYLGAVQYSSSYSVQWADADQFLSAPSPNHVHVVVRDANGEISGVENTILEVYQNLSTVPGSSLLDGSVNYIKDVLENRSQYITITEANANALTTSAVSEEQTMTGGADGEDEADISIGAVAQGYDLYKDSSVVDVSLLIQGKARGSVLANYITSNIAESRKDCVSFVSPTLELSDTPEEVISWAAPLTGSSYMIVDSGYKYQYDKYNDVYRWVPLNGDIAGLCARTDVERDPWFSPAGYNRGIIKNVVKLRYNPTKAQRDQLYLNSINPVITEPGSGALLFGDKTYSPIASAFDRINVRRLFIVLEKAIANASKALLFEFNDEFTRAQFKNLVEPFLREVQGRRGIFDFRVVCDETNNTPQVIDSNQFVGDIFIKPARSINFIQLNFVAVRTGVEFEEVVGAV